MIAAIRRFINFIVPPAINSFLGLFSVFAILALFTSNPSDPSLNVATRQPPTNIFGSFGSYIADFFLQTFGIISYLIVFLLFLRAIFFFRSFKRFSALGSFLALLFISVVCKLANFWTPGNSWAYSGYGGVVGYIMDSILMGIFGHRHIQASFWIMGTIVVIFTLREFNQPKRFIAQNVNRCIRFYTYFRRKWKFKAFFKKAPNVVPVTDPNLIVPKLEAQRSEKATPISTEIPTPLSTDEPVNENFSFFRKWRGTEVEKKSSENKKYPDFRAMLPRILDDRKIKKNQISVDYTENLRDSLKKVLEDFSVFGEIISYHVGPVITLYEFEPTPGTKSSRVVGLSDDIARSLSAISARIAVIPGKNALGIELPNPIREMVNMKEVLASEDYQKKLLALPIALGKDIAGNPVIVDLAKMPHLLVAGTTGSGKSVGINAMITSLLFALSPEECRFIMIDPKMLELSVYNGIPHLLTPVVTDPKKAVGVLKWVVREMEERYRRMSYLGVRNIRGFNEKIKEAMENNLELKKRVNIGTGSSESAQLYEDIKIKKETLPFIVVVVDEMADLMLVAGKEIEFYIQRLAQMARAAGIHIIVATQRPSVDVITGVIKANLPTRISFAVTSKIDSRTILGEQGAEQLLGLGDMLYMPSGGKIVRVHGAFISDTEVEKVVEELHKFGPPEYDAAIMEKLEEEESEGDDEGGSDDDNKDETLYKQAVSVVLKDKKTSISYVQRQLRIGYNKAANFIERMERDKILTPQNHLGKREILENKATG